MVIMNTRRSCSGHLKGRRLKSRRLLQSIQVSKAPTIVQPQVFCPKTPPDSQADQHRPNNYLIISLNEFNLNGETTLGERADNQVGSSSNQAHGENLETDPISERQIRCSFLKASQKRTNRAAFLELFTSNTPARLIG